MSKLWLVACYEYRRHVFKKSFILVMLSAPLMVGLIIGTVWLTDRLKTDNNAVGYVDLAGLLTNPIPPPRPGSSPDDPSTPGTVPLVRFDTTQAARAALELGEIQAYYVVVKDHLATNQVELFFVEPPDGKARRTFWDFMQINKLNDLPSDIAGRAVADSNLIVRWPDDGPGGGREFSQRGFFNQFLPLIVGVAFVFLLLMSSGYLMGAVAEEKGNRTIEILVTSLTSVQLMGGKIVGVIAVTATQLIAWIAFACTAVLFGGRVLGFELFQNLSLDLGIIMPIIVLFLPAYVMMAALMTVVGVSVNETQEAQQLMGLFILPSMVPIWLAGLILEHPDGPVAIGLSLFPITAMSTYSLRVAFAPVPTWQLATSILTLSLCACGALWLAERAFRLGMLRYGQKLHWRNLFAGG